MLSYFKDLSYLFLASLSLHLEYLKNATHNSYSPYVSIGAVEVFVSIA